MDLKVSADIGVYRGRSLFPQGIAHNSFTKGVVYGIDPYSDKAAIQNDRPDLKEALDAFVENTDFNELYTFVNNLIQEERLEDSCKLVRKKSIDAAIDFKKDNILFDLVHIDGNHDTSSVLNDVEFYSPLLKNKGFIVLDDISWESVKPAYDILNNQMNLIDELVDESNDFALFSKGLDEDEIERVQKIFKLFI
jgi:flagellin-like hook-associated protein FlgL